MMQFTIQLMKRTEVQAEQLFHVLNDSKEKLHNKEHIHVVFHRMEGMHRIEVNGKMPGFQRQKETDGFYTWAAEALAEYILLEEEQLLLRHIIKQQFHFEQEEEIQGILSFCGHMLSGSGEWVEEQISSETFKRRKIKVASELAEFLKQHTELNLEGFLRFRLKSYVDELRDVVEYAVDEFVMDRQYQEFISLLKYFVYIQEAKIPFVHLIHKGGNEFILLDDRMEPIDTDEADAVVTVEMLEKDMNFEDMIVSTLITVSPQQIYIHTRDPEQQVIQTIRQIFENRVELCGYCRMCHNLDRGAAAEYNKG